MINRTRRTSGFTLIELILVIVILGILSSMVVPNFVGVSDDARVAATQSDMVVIGNALDRYEIYYGTYPTGLEGLLAGPDGRKFLKENKVPLDHWGNPFHYRFPGSHNTDSFDLSSGGPDGTMGGPDDITNWD